ncbi:hypothetical protein [Nannocystis pusilla]|uniref:hypothetical protein n=1 Tax=Nannocystis pusilla TaxID=889268 RepID=UPI003B7AF255
MSESTARSAALVLAVFAVACGKPVDPSGKEDATFTKASMAGVPAPTGEDRPLSADLAVEPVSMLVSFNRLKTADKLQEALNKKPGQFSHIDLDKDTTPDLLTVADRATKDGHAFEIRVRPATGEFVVATMLFDPEWSYLGHYDGVMGGAASTTARPLPAAPQPGPRRSRRRWSRPRRRWCPRRPRPRSRLRSPRPRRTRDRRGARTRARAAGAVQAAPAGGAQPVTSTKQ